MQIIWNFYKIPEIAHFSPQEQRALYARVMWLPYRHAATWIALSLLIPSAWLVDQLDLSGWRHILLNGLAMGLCFSVVQCTANHILRKYHLDMLKRGGVQ